MSAVVAFVACGGSSTTEPAGFGSPSGNVTSGADGGSDGTTASTENSSSGGGYTNSSSSSSSSSSGGGAGSCASTCNVDGDCQSCGDAGETWCCASGSCYQPMSGVCSDIPEAGTTE
jgi:hypothetical protein